MNGGCSPGGHEVVVVENFDESLDLGSLGDLLLAHGGGHLTGVAVDACDQSVAVGTVGGAIVDVLGRSVTNHVPSDHLLKQDEEDEEDNFYKSVSETVVRAEDMSNISAGKHKRCF